MATIWTSYQGVEVVESDSNVQYRHPRLGGDNPPLAPLEGATLLALADGVFLVVCDAKGCRYNGITGNEPYVKPVGEQRAIVDQAGSLFSHINGKHRKGNVDRKVPAAMVVERSQTSSRYTEAQIRVAIKIWLKWKATRIKHWTQSACDELERLGFEPSFAEKWNPDQLGSLVRQYMKRDKYKNIKAGPMDETDREALAEMVREAAERAGGSKTTTVASNVRITERRPTPNDHKRNVETAAEAAKERREPEVEETVSGANPTLSFAGRGYVEPTKTLTIDHTEVEAAVVPADPEVTIQVTGALVPASDYEHILELEDGTPVFRYKDTLMAGKKVKGVEV